MISHVVGEGEHHTVTKALESIKSFDDAECAWGEANVWYVLLGLEGPAYYISSKIVEGLKA